MPAVITTLSVLLWFLLALKVMGSGLDTYLGEQEPAQISPVIAEIIDGVARPVHGIRDNGPCGEARPCVGIVTPDDTTTAVPVPPALWMLAGAVGALVMVKRRR